MAVQAKTKKADKIVVGQALAKKIQDELPMMNAEKLLKNIHKLQEKLQSIYNGDMGVFPKIENKPFYYFTAGKFYLVDPARYLVPNSGDIPSEVSGVPTTHVNWSQFGQICNYYKSCPIYSDKCIVNKDKSIHRYIVG